MTAEIQKKEEISHEILSNVLLKGDLSALTAQQKYEYAMGLARAVGLSPTTMPFQILRLQGKERIYADKGTAEQLRAIHGLSFGKPEFEYSAESGVLDVVISITDGKRTDYEMGSVFIGNLKGEALANGKMKALTKAKRRATLSFCGLGMLDESEISSIKGAETDEIVEPKMATAEQKELLKELIEQLPEERREKGIEWLNANHITEAEAQKHIGRLQNDVREADLEIKLKEAALEVNQ